MSADQAPPPFNVDSATVPPPVSDSGWPAAWIPVMVERIVAEFAPLKVILFGSQARGDARADSDIDLLIVMPEEWAGRRQRDAAVAIRHTLRHLPVPKDIVVTTPAELSRRGHLAGTILHEALHEGTVLYEHS